VIARLIDNVLRFLVCRIHRRAIVVLSLLPPTCGGLLFEPGRLCAGRDLTFFRVRLSSADQLGAVSLSLANAFERWKMITGSHERVSLAASGGPADAMRIGWKPLSGDLERPTVRNERLSAGRTAAEQIDTTLSDGWRAILVRVVHRGRGGEGMMLFRVFKNH